MGELTSVRKRRSRGRILRVAAREQDALEALEEAAELAAHIAARRLRATTRPTSQ